MRHVGAGYETLLSFRYEPARDYRETMEVVPWLAESWEQPDDTTYVLALRRGVQWHDGAPFTAEDVAFTFQWLRHERLGAAARLVQADAFEVLDPFTIRIVLNKPSPDFLQELADRNLLMVPKHVVERGGDLDKVLIGTGPFQLKSFRAGVESLWERNDGYWQPGRPHIERVRQVWGLEGSAMTASFIAGESDLLAIVDETLVQAVRAARPTSGLRTLVTENGFGLLLKLDRPPFHDARVRRALHLTVDRATMNQTLANGKGRYVTPGVWPGREGWAIPQEELRNLPGYRTPKDGDLAEARRLLAEAGYPEGFSFSVIYNAGGTSAPRLAEMIAAQLPSIGVRADLKPLESGVYNQTDLRTGDWDGANLPSLVNAQLQGLYERFHSNGPYNKTGLSDPWLDVLIDVTLSGQDLEARRKGARRLQEYLLERAYFIPTIEFASRALWQPWVGDYSPNPGDSVTPNGPTYSQAWLDVDGMPPSRR